jgi:hypothetical protein
MKRKINCDQCHGEGFIIVDACDTCGSYPAGKYEEKYLCQECWGKTLTDEEIAAL